MRRSAEWKRWGCRSVMLGTVVVLVVRLVREERTLDRVEGRCRTTSHLANRRAAAGTVLVESRGCRVNTSSLDAGVCVALEGETHCVPSLAVIGAMKSGTTNVMLYLSLHPRLRTSENRVGWPVESRFFSQARDASKADEWRDYVRRYPSPTRVGELAFDKSPNYLVNPAVPAVLHALAPSLKLVVMLRNPTKRAYSHFQHDCRNGRVGRDRRGRIVRGIGPPSRRLGFPCAPVDFHSMVASDVTRAQHAYGFPTDGWLCRWTYADGLGDSGPVPRGLYACQLKRWLALFPRAQLLPLVFERFVATRHQTLKAVAAVERFVGVPAYDYDASWRVALVERVYAALPSRGSAYAPMQPATAAILDDLYCDPNRQIIHLLRPQVTDLPWPCGESAGGPVGGPVGGRTTANGAGLRTTNSTTPAGPQQLLH